MGAFLPHSPATTGPCGISQVSVQVGIQVVFRKTFNTIFKGLTAIAAIPDRHLVMPFTGFLKALLVDSKTQGAYHGKITSFPLSSLARL